MRDIVLLFLAAATVPLQTPVQTPLPGPGLHLAQSAPVPEDQTPTGRFTTATEVRPILDATRMSWIATRDWEGQQLLYVTHLWSWRCGLAQIEIGLNGAAPEVWPLPACHLDQAAPNAILDGDGLPYRAFPPGSLSRIEVWLTYDDLGTARAVFDGNGVLVE